MPSHTSTRLEFRIRSDTKRRIEHAASLVGESVSDFARSASEQRAEQVLLDNDAITIVPADFFDQLMDALEDEPMPNAPLARAASRARDAARSGPAPLER
jgi:uncharacterized protein (DUF1778 family)